METVSNLKIYIICFILFSLIFIVDINIQLGVAGGVPYVAVILVSLWSTKANLELYLGILASALVMAGLYLSPAGGVEWIVYANRGLALFVIWVTVVLAMKWKQQKDALFKVNLQKEQEKKEIYFATIESSQHIINNLLNQLQYIKMEIEECDNLDKDTISIFNEIVNESSVLMNKLSSVKDINKNDIKDSIH